MILLDANVLLYAYNSSCPEHSRAKDYVESLLNREEEVLLPWVVVLAFLRISTNPRAFPQPLKSSEARAIVNSWLQQPNVRIANPGEGHWQILDSLLEVGGVVGNLTTDAHIAALAIEHDAPLSSCDSDFKIFEAMGLTWQDPLAVEPRR